MGDCCDYGVGLVPKPWLRPMKMKIGAQSLPTATVSCLPKLTSRSIELLEHTVAQSDDRRHSIMEDTSAQVPTQRAPADARAIDDRTRDSHESQDARAHDFQVSQFADRKTLSGWFPQIKHDEDNSWRMWLSRRSRALMLQIGIIGVILMTNLGVTIFAVTSYGSRNGVGLIYNGDCSTVKKLDQWLHLLINLLGTGMLSASNYCMQLQAAPTRADVDRAHRDGKWLDIGIPSPRNLKYLSSWRRVSWTLLALTSIPIHLMWVILLSES